MNPKINIALLAFISLLFVTCQKEPIEKPQPEPGYPTTYKPLTSAEWEVRNTEFQQINIHDGLSLNEYGFVEGEINLPDIDSITQILVSEIISQIVTNYKKFLGIPDFGTGGFENLILIEDPNYVPGPAKIEIERFYRNIGRAKEEGYYNDYIRDVVYNFFLVQNRIENRYFKGSEISFNFYPIQNSVTLVGNWFPEAKIPSQVFCTETEAFMIARERILEKTGKDIWEEKHHYQTSRLMQKTIRNGNIEIRDCWCVGTAWPFYAGYVVEVHIDSQTGEIVFYRNKLEN